jgi:solute carrier family 25 folate transporter 32
VVDHLLAGVEAGSIMVVITNPLWIMKTRLQIQGQYSTPNKYTGFRNIFATMLREEGIRGFYKGFLPSLLLTTHGAVQVSYL